MIKSQSTKDTVKNVTSELFSLSPSHLIQLFEIDVSQLGVNQGVVSETEVVKSKNVIFRFHNNINLTTKSLFWQGNEYIAAPIIAEGFETSVRGSPPTPKLSVTVSDEGIPHLTRLKERIRELGDIVGAKFTRIRTFSKFLDAVNFLNKIPPRDFFPDPNAEIGRDIFYIDRKSGENKNSFEYELSSLFELEGVKLPARLVSSNSCQWQYRSHGCCYEYNSRRNESHEDATLPESAPPKATSFGELITTLITGVPFTDKGQHNPLELYNKGDTVYINQRGNNYYFVSKANGNGITPPDGRYWVFDDCDRKIGGCKIRHGVIGDGTLPMGTFISVNRFR